MEQPSKIEVTRNDDGSYVRIATYLPKEGEKLITDLPREEDKKRYDYTLFISHCTYFNKDHERVKVVVLTNRGVQVFDGEDSTPELSFPAKV